MFINIMQKNNNYSNNKYNNIVTQIYFGVVTVQSCNFSCLNVGFQDV